MFPISFFGKLRARFSAVADINQKVAILQMKTIPTSSSAEEGNTKLSLVR
ncbi:MAG: hypothetical protein WCO37_00390 [Bacteroidota bacterium]